MTNGATPRDLRYTEQHEWVRDEGDGLVRVGITGFAQSELGDVVYVDLPSPGTDVSKGQPFGEVESTKSVSDLYAPLTGTIEDRNDQLEERPELVNEDPYGEGWMVAIRCSDPDELSGLMDADGYDAHIG